MKNELKKLLKDREAEFVFDAGVWCLCGVTRDGNAWETDDFEAGSLEDAEDQAIEFIYGLIESEAHDAAYMEYSAQLDA